MTVARRAAVASRPPHSAASFTSPRSLTHSASTPAGSTSCGMPGAVFTQASPASSDSTKDQGGFQASSEKARPRPVRRAGSAKATSNGRMSTSSASATPTAPGRPSADEVRGRDRDPHRVDVDAGRGDACPGEGEQVAADPAAEVDHRRGAERLEPSRPVGGDGEPGGLLEPVRREVHRRGQVAELLDGPGRAARPGSAPRPAARTACRDRLVRVRSGPAAGPARPARRPARAPAGRRRSAATARTRRPRATLSGTPLMRVLVSVLALSV